MLAEKQTEIDQIKQQLESERGKIAKALIQAEDKAKELIEGAKERVEKEIIRNDATIKQQQQVYQQYRSEILSFGRGLAGALGKFTEQLNYLALQDSIAGEAREAHEDRIFKQESGEIASPDSSKNLHIL